MKGKIKVLGLVMILGLATAVLMTGAPGWAQKKPTPVAGDPAIVFISYSTWARTDLMVMDANGANAKMLLSGVKAPGYGFYNPQWSPNGEWIVLGRTDGECTSTSEGIFLVKKDGTGLCQVGLMVNTPYMHGYPQWSPEASRLIYSDSQPPIELGSCFFMLDAVCGAPYRVHVNHPPHGFFGSLTLSPDGNRMAASVTDEPVPPATEPTSGLYVFSMGRDEEGRWLEAIPLIELTSAGPLKGAGLGGIDWAHHPIFDRFVVAASPVGQSQSELYLISLNDPFNPVNISNTPDVSESSPCWSPLDDQIVYVRNDCIYIMNVDGSGQKVIATPARGRRLCSPAWRHNQ